MIDMSVRDPETSARAPRSADPTTISPTTIPPAPRPTAASTAAAERPGPARVGPRPAPGNARSKADPAVARFAVGALGIAATTALVAAIAGGASASAAVPTTSVGAPAPSSAPVANVPVRHVTKVVTLPSNVTPPPRKIIYATPVPAPPQQTVIVQTTQSGKVIP